VVGLGLESVHAAEILRPAAAVEEHALRRREPAGVGDRAGGRQGRRGRRGCDRRRGREHVVARDRLVHELVAQHEAYGIERAALTQHVLQREVTTARHVALGEAARPRVTAAIAQQAVVAESRYVVLAELSHQRNVLQNRYTRSSVYVQSGELITD